MRVSSGKYRPRISLRTRLTLWVVSIFLLIKTASGVAFWFYEKSSIHGVFEAKLTERTESMAYEIEEKLPNLTAAQLQEVADRASRFFTFDRFGVDVVNIHGKSIVRPQTAWPKAAAKYAIPAIKNNRTRTGSLSRSESNVSIPDTSSAQVIARPLSGSDQQLALFVVANDAYVTRQLALVRRVLVIWTAVGVCATAISGWFIAGIAVEPIHRLSEMAHQLSPESIDRSLVMPSRDIEIAELTRELDAARERIRAAFAAQERFLSNISHEIKTPISTLLTEAQTIDRGKLPLQARDFLETAEDEMRKLGRLIESFLTLTRVRDGKGIAELHAYPANELVMDSVESCLSMAEQYAVRLEPTLAQDEAGMEATLRGDPQLLRTMVDNLIRNAVRFTPRGGTVRVIASVQGDNFCIAVQDQGPGLPPEILDRLFDRFAQSSEELRRERGHGLGLAIAQGVAELHEGTIQVRNLTDRGAEFTARLPLRRTSTRQTLVSQASRPSNEGWNESSEEPSDNTSAID